MIPSSTLDFLRDLKVNNNKQWFDQNRKRYDKVKVDYLSLAGLLLEEMKKFDPSLEMLSAKDCIFRINRDIRFSTNKEPYKTNLGIVLYPGGKKSNLAAYYFHIEEGRAFVGGGLWLPEPHLLNKVRREIHYFYKDFLKVIEEPSFRNTYKSLDVEEGQKLSRPPKGYDANDPAIEFLKLKSFTAGASISDKLLTSKELVASVIEHFKQIKPLILFLNRALMSDADGGL